MSESTWLQYGIAGAVLVVTGMFVLYLKDRDKSDRIERENQKAERASLLVAFTAERQSFLSTIETIGDDFREAMQAVGKDVKEAGETHSRSAEKVCEALNGMCKAAGIAHARKPKKPE